MLDLVPVNSFNQYVLSVRAIPSMDNETTIQLIRQYRVDGCRVSAKQVIVGHLKHVVSIAYKYCKVSNKLPDAVQAGNVGLMLALQKYDLSKSDTVKFSSYYSLLVKHEILSFMASTHSIVCDFTKDHDIKKAYFNRNKFPRTAQGITEMSETLNIPRHKVMLCLEHSRDVQSIDSEDFEDTTTSPDDPVYQYEMLQDQRTLERIKTILHTLKPKNRDIIEKRFFTDPPMTLQEIANIHNCTAESIRQIEERTLAVVKKKLLN